MGRVLRVAAVVLGFALVAAPVGAADDELLGALKRVEKVTILGNQKVESGTLRKVLRTGDTNLLGLGGPPLFRPDFLRTDIGALRTLYQRRGFLDATAAAAADSGSKPGRVVVTFHVTEGVQVLVRSVIVDSTSLFTRDEILEKLKLTSGEPFDPVQLPLDRLALANLYAERGHFPAIRSETTRDGDRMDVRFVIRDGPEYRVGELRVSGVAKVDTSAVTREVLLDPGAPYRRDRLVESTERLTGTGLFTSVEIQPVRPDSNAARVDLDVKVRERKPRWVEGGIGTGTEEWVRVGGRWGHRNLYGKGQALTATAGAGYNGGEEVRTKLELAYVEPWLFGTRLRGRVAVSAERGFDEFSGRTYIQEAAGVSFGVSRDFYSADARISLTMDNVWTRVAKVISQTPGDTSTFYLAPYQPRFTLAFDQDRRDDPLVPRKGALNHLSAQLSGDPNSDAGWYSKLEASSGMHRPSSRRSSVALRARLGVVVPVGTGLTGYESTLGRVPVTDRYRVGGSATVRGYHENGIDAGGDGGTLLGVVNAEWRRRLRGAVGLTLFVDGGNVWRDPTQVRLEGIFTPTGVDRTYGRDDVHWAAGIGLHVITPIGPMRLDYARRLFADESDLLAGRTLERSGLNFAIGFMF